MSNAFQDFIILLAYTITLLFLSFVTSFNIEWNYQVHLSVFNLLHKRKGKVSKSFASKLYNRPYHLWGGTFNLSFFVSKWIIPICYSNSKMNFLMIKYFDRIVSHLKNEVNVSM